MIERKAGLLALGTRPVVLLQTYGFLEAFVTHWTLVWLILKDIIINNQVQQVQIPADAGPYSRCDGRIREAREKVGLHY